MMHWSPWKEGAFDGDLIWFMWLSTYLKYVMVDGQIRIHVKIFP
jgi:hypothetical protein